jgi:RES domain-containing protein
LTAQVLAQVLDRTLTAYRIGDPDGAYPIFSAKGSSLHPGRWNTVDTPVIYASEHCATAMLERLAAQGALPANQHYVEVTIDAGCSYEVFSEAHHPGWQDPSRNVSRAFGSGWRHEARSAILFVPSIVARMERNVLINPDHPDFARIHPGLHRPLWWDERLFS